MVGMVRSVALLGLEARPVHIECAINDGLPALRLVGLPDAAVREAGDRVRAAVRRCGLRWPDRNVVVNLAPASLPKVGSGFDLGVALAVLAASEQIEMVALRGTWAIGELGLDGTARATAGILPAAAAAHRHGADRVIVPEAAAVEAQLVEGLRVVPVADLAEAVAIVRGDRRPRPGPPPSPPSEPPIPDLRDVRGQHQARRALEIAAVGAHHLLLSGPPGCGKSMLAERLPGLLPPLETDAALEVAAVHSIAGSRRPHVGLSRRPPFRAPHHTTTAVGLVGGGSGVARPGEISLAHHGVLFIDELLEVPRWILDALRQPLERGSVTVVRARATVTYPARFLLVAATNPCPCGYLGDDRRPCRCRPDQIDRYRGRLSGPLLDRIDLQVPLRAVEADRLIGAPQGEPTAAVARRVEEGRAGARERWGAGILNASVGLERLRAVCTRPALRRAARAVESLRLSARAFDSGLRVARTVADLAGAEVVAPEHVDEAVAYRLPDAVAAS